MRLHVLLTSSAVTLLLAAAPIAGCGRAELEVPPPSSPPPTSPSSPSLFPCDDPGVIKIAGEETGYAFCTDGPVHRPEIKTCPSKIPRSAFTCDSQFGGECKADADCSFMLNGFCSSAKGKGTCFCNSGCTIDADCGPGAICFCGDPVGQCVSALCTSDADCKEGALCAEFALTPGCEGSGFACQDELDECQSDADCVGTEECTLVETSFPSGVSHRLCGAPLCQF